MFYIVHNPASTNAKTGRRFIDELRQRYGTAAVKIIRTNTKQSECTFEKLAEKTKDFDDDTILGVAAGDGTVSGVINTLLTNRAVPTKARQTPVLPLWSGSANDLAVMLNGMTPSKVAPIVKRGHKIKIYPIVCRLIGPDGVRTTRLAACYASFGASGYAAKHLNSKNHRNNPIHRFSVLKAISETVATLNGLGEANKFQIVEDDGVKVVYERLFINGSRFAKNQVFPVQLEKPGYTMISVPRKNLFLVFVHMLNLLRKNELEQQTERQEFTIENDIVAQFDGEPYEIARGTRVSVSLSARPFYAIATLSEQKHESTIKATHR